MIKKATVILILGWTVFSLICTKVQGQPWEVPVDNTVIFSSPRLRDLTGDGILDVVVGDGIEDSIRGNIRAFDGVDGTLLWNVEVEGDVFASAMFYDITGDETDDIVIGGRDRQFHAVDGSSGDLIWSFDTTQSAPLGIGWMQFYNSELIPDQDNDGLMDLVVTNGGNPNAMAGEGPRFPGWLLVVSSANGMLLSSAIVPDSAETYSSLVVADIENDGILDIVFGTGGETFPGGLWRTTVNDLLSNDISSAIALAENDTHGFVAAPVLADINRDDVLDVVSADAEGTVAAFNGISNEMMWSFQLPVTECYSTPAVGEFTGTDHLDVYANIGKGVWPFFNKYYQVLIDGESGEMVYLDSIGHQFSSPLSYDFDDDGFDEALLASNETSIFSPNTFSLIMVDFNDLDTTILYQQNNAVSGASTPWIGDIDGNGVLDAVVAFNTNASIYNYSLARFPLPYNVTDEVKWGAYHGSNYNGVYEFIEYTPLATEQTSPILEEELNVWPNPTQSHLNLPKGQPALSNTKMSDALGRDIPLDDILLENKLDMRTLPEGVYFLHIHYQTGKTKYYKLVKQ